MTKTLGNKTTCEVKIGSTWTKASGFVDFDGIGSGATPMIDASDMDSDSREKLPGMPDAGSITLNFHFNVDDNAQAALRAAHISRALTEVRLTTPDDHFFSFSGYVTTAALGARIDEIIPLAVAIEITGDITEGTAA